MPINCNFDKSNLQDGFWKELQDKFRDITIDAVYTQFKNSGRFEAIKLTWREGMPNKPDIYWESDVTKWIEGASYFLTKKRNPALEEKIDEIVDDLARAQGEDGYLNEYFTVVEPKERFQRRGAHELYCAGHLIEAAIAYDQATGKSKLLEVAMRYADLIDKVFRLEHTAAFDTPGHEEIELALIKLYLYTEKENYFKLAEFFIDERGNSNKDTTYGIFDLEHIQGHLPVREQKTMEGHSVRALYLLSAMADMARIKGDETLGDRCKLLYENITNKRMYITGGIGSTYRGESFTYDYHLPEYTAYCETCASIALALFCRRMWLLDRNAKYADTAERAIYNTVLSGISLSGDKFFYENPISSSPHDWDFNAGRPEALQEHLAIQERVKIFTCSCCPPNLIRLVGSIADYMYTVEKDVIYTQCYMAASTQLEVNGKKVRLEQETQYPYDGKIRITVYGNEQFSLAVRIPNWCKQEEILVNGKRVEKSAENGYQIIERVWKNGDVVEINLPMEIQFITANPNVTEACGRVAISKGPIVYCAEGLDNDNRPLKDLRISRSADFQTEWEQIDQVKIPALLSLATCRKPLDQLYTFEESEILTVKMKYIPYFARANRGVSEMTTWFLEAFI